MPFRLDAQYWFVTYSQCDVDKADILTHIVTRHPTRTPDWVIVVRERHDDGGLHLHAVINWGSRLCTRDQRFLDYTDQGTVYHPKLEPARSVTKALQYVAKEDAEPYTYGEVPEPSAAKRDRGDLIRELLATANSAEELLSNVREADPVHYVEKIFQWERVAQREFEYTCPPDTVEQRPFHHVPAEVQDWLDTEFKEEVSKSNS